MNWREVTKFDKRALDVVDGRGRFLGRGAHYSRRKPGAPQYMPPGETLCLLSVSDDAVWGWWRPHPGSGLVAMNGLDGWTCSMFRNLSDALSSALILDAERALVEWPDAAAPCGPHGMLTYVFDRRVQSRNPGYCYKLAGWQRVGRSADKRKTLLWKPTRLAGIAACPADRIASFPAKRAAGLTKDAAISPCARGAG